MNKGDLVTLKDWCKNSGRAAIITEVPVYLHCAKIMFLDTFQVVSALKTNLVLLEEQ